MIAKVMTNRVKSSIMPKLISQNQCAFVEERVIEGNIIVAHEAFHYQGEEEV